VTKAALTFEEALPYFGEKGIVTGNPVRKEFFDIAPKLRGEKTNLLIFGGSQGARAINNAMAEALEHLPPEKLQITHQTGESDFENIKERYVRAGWNEAEVRPYISDMVAEFTKSDLIICRAGATSCAEIAAAGKAAIMIPLPTAADDHQRKNAEALQNAGAARMILQRDLSAENLAQAIKDLMNSPEKISAMEIAAKKLARKDAAEVTVNLIESLIKGRK
jgi:UDP-N-acetylglucosamine--N-acetylmuramyl-(pentapeptide) pyrophosphoryl-undecaprenol N-acetylglucosamine transferase